MKRAFILISFSALLLGRSAWAQDGWTTNASPAAPAASTTSAAAIAAKQDADERYERMSTDLQAVQADNQDLRAKITSMEQEIQALRDAQAKPADNSAMQDEMKKLADAIQEVDKKRQADTEAISEQIRNSIGQIEHAVGNGTPTPTHVTHPKTEDTTPAPNVDGYSYTVVEGDRLDLIVKAYNAEYRSKGLKTITMRQTREANPNVDWNRLRIGQKIIVPKPPGG
jgi:TolA-binding protein